MTLPALLSPLTRLRHLQHWCGSGGGIPQQWQWTTGTLQSIWSQASGAASAL